MIQPKHIQQQEKLKAYRKANGSPTAPDSVPSKWGMNNRATLLSKQNRAETYIENALKRSGLLYVREYAMRHDKKDFFVDFVVVVGSARVGVEVDGGRHMDPVGQAKDRVREKALFDSGEVTHVVRFSWARTLKLDPSSLNIILIACADAPCKSSTLLY